MTEKSQTPEKEVLTQAKKDTTPVYELGYHVVPTIPEDGVTAVVEKVKKALGGAEIISEQTPALMPFAYQIERSVQGKREKYTEGYFGFLKFAMDKSEMQAFKEAVRSMPEVLRFLVINTVREDAPAPRRAVFNSRQLEGEVIKKPEGPAEKPAEVSQEELDKTIDALVSTE
jgi:ribosomal protein S6